MCGGAARGARVFFFFFVSVSAPPGGEFNSQENFETSPPLTRTRPARYPITLAFKP